MSFFSASKAVARSPVRLGDCTPGAPACSAASSLCAVAGSVDVRRMGAAEKNSTSPVGEFCGVGFVVADRWTDGGAAAVACGDRWTDRGTTAIACGDR